MVFSPLGFKVSYRIEKCGLWFHMAKCKSKESAIYYCAFRLSTYTRKFYTDDLLFMHHINFTLLTNYI